LIQMHASRFTESIFFDCASPIGALSSTTPLFASNRSETAYGMIQFLPKNVICPSGIACNAVSIASELLARVFVK
jgi:hypothetical protein